MIYEIGIYLVCSLLFTGAQILSITPPGTQIKHFDSGIIFTCALAGYKTQGGSTNLRWVGPNRRYINETKGRVYIERQDQFILRLYITEIQERDAGIYSCEADVNGNIMAQEARMFLFEDIKFQDAPTSVEGVIGSDQLLRCQATGQPEPEMSWRFNDHKIRQDKKKYLEEEGGLRVIDLDLRDAGSYECRAEVSSHGNLKVRTVTLDVLYAPVMLRELPPTWMAIKGKPAELTCDAAGNPPVAYDWFKESKTVYDVRVRVRLPTAEKRLTIKAAEEEDEGRYICRASNSLGHKETTTAFSLIIPPRVGDLPAQRTAVEGQTLELQCEASGFPTPNISWTKGGEHMDTPTQEPLHQDDDGRISSDVTRAGLNRLVIHEIRRNDTGSYSCSAINGGGNDVKTVSVVVEYLPTVEVEGQKVEMGWPGRVVTFSCVGHGLPVPTITWIHNSQNVVDSDTFTIKTTRLHRVTSTLQIKMGDRLSSSLFGGYMCIAKNGLGHDIQNMTLTEAESPDPPANISVVEEGSTWVRLSAHQPKRNGGATISRWKVTHEPLGPGAPPPHQTITLFEDASNLTVGGLKPGSVYTFYLHAGNAVGFGKPVKFLVRTTRRNQFNEQLDVPNRFGDGDNNNASVDAVAEVSADQKKPVLMVDMVKTGDDQVDFAAGDILLSSARHLSALVLAVGSAVVMATAVVVVCLVWRSRRRRIRRQVALRSPRETTTFAEEKKNKNKNKSVEPISPFSGVTTSMTSVRGGVQQQQQQQRAGTYSPHQGQKSAGVEAAAEEAGERGDSLQRRAWEAMIRQRKALEEERFQAATDQVSAPVPPGSGASPFVLLGGASCYPESDDDLRREGLPGSGVYGYHSADSVDDDIDEIDYTIRAPSYRAQSQRYP